MKGGSGDPQTRHVRIPILHRYVFSQLLSNLGFALLVFVLLFLVVDFFDRIDNIVSEDPDPGTVALYFLYKIPMTVSLMTPVAMLVASLFTVGLLSKNSELTAMRAAGCTVVWLARPIIVVGLLLSVLSAAMNEYVVPYATRRVREIYNLDIKRKDKSGGYSREDIWWRAGRDFYSVRAFDSRTDTLHGVTRFEMSDDFEVVRRTDAAEARWVDPVLGWTMFDVTRRTYTDPLEPEVQRDPKLPLPVPKTPADFYDAETDPHTMSFSQLRAFMAQQSANGLPTVSYAADLYDKIAFPFSAAVLGVVVIPFALSPARSGSMAAGILSALVIGFTYYVVQSVSISMGRAELLPPLLAAWTANIVMSVVAGFLILGSEAPG